jgi:hypothetical protein
MLVKTLNNQIYQQFQLEFPLTTFNWPKQAQGQQYCHFCGVQK